MNSLENSKASELNEFLSTSSTVTAALETLSDAKKQSPTMGNDENQDQHEIIEENEVKELEEEEYVINNSYGIFNWARFQTGPIKASEIKEVYPELHEKVIERCITYLARNNKLKVNLNNHSRTYMLAKKHM